MTKADMLIFEDIIQAAINSHGGHFTIMKFTTNWRVGFGTPMDRDDINNMSAGKTFAEAAKKALKRRAVM